MCCVHHQVPFPTRCTRDSFDSIHSLKYPCCYLHDRIYDAARYSQIRKAALCTPPQLWRGTAHWPYHAAPIFDELRFDLISLISSSTPDLLIQ
jgi:hypothetical protein